jgi:transcriptional regulator with XRE-family HTH domain
MLNIKVGQLIYTARREASMSQDDLCIKAGISRTMLSMLENDKRSPSLEMLRKLAKAMGCELTISFNQRENHITEVDLKGIFD